MRRAPEAARTGRLRFKAETLKASFGFAFEGVWYCLRTQRNMRVHVVAGFAAMGLGFWLGLPARDLAIVAVVSSLVVTLEMLNTAIEAAVDIAVQRKHPLAKIAKDVAAAAVLVSAANALVVAALLLLPPLVRRLMPMVGPSLAH